VARLLQQAGLKDAELQSFTASLASSLRGMAGDDRSFTYYAAPTGPAMLNLEGELKARKLDPLPLAEAYRLYLVHRLTADRCADDYLINNGPLTIYLATNEPAETLGYGAAKFFAANMLVPPLTPLTEQETTPNSLHGVADAAHSCKVDTQCQQIDEMVRNLAFTPAEIPRPDSEHDTDEWHAALRKTIEALEAWQPAKGQPDYVFPNKIWVYNNLWAMSHGPYRELVVRSWLAYLKQSRATVDHAQWLLPVSVLIGRAALNPSDRNLAEQLRAQDDPVIKLYLQVETMAPRGPEIIMTLL
jgi:hypothetical protein